ncbi:sulfotransferase family 2 domain-containing protein [Mesobacterium sp. TK19101]|uniref:Sulfotransferase family 2 domain-containing protein n=1 Tax=Mesobacterium hydrothermale TaxID=3111907 RepID=A0ABU6HJ53_9RHOB|nr:sulfotransferase family 2 domain-containing protein [Mesobacterium sp. TK19101]MEC3862487.1 sulfotransferase family 2 domain-containing protein [Mesobacterium sp. TK19101]
MIISAGRQYIFVHVPKTGGTSFARALEARAMADDILIGDTPKALRRKARLKSLNPRGRLWKHATLADIDGILTPGQIAGMFCVTLVRNPWDRAVSYYHWLQRQGFDHPAVGLAQSLGFADFLRHPQTVASLSGWPVARYMTDVTGVDRTSAVLRLEHLEEDIAGFAAHLGFRPEMPHVNRSNRRREYRGYYDAALADHLGRVCSVDVARFGYRFE